ncbi:rhomboid family intramembrane serine protease [Alteromonas sp. CYL-A6]|uniref:rhomboid family intramembrane serine protease n=1 Tax=Alteromonas nitratireducens TaxID=3390813 RepID=UPI0034B84A0A
MNEPSLTLKQQATTLTVVAVLLIVCEILNIFTGNALNQFGVLPRHLFSLWHVVTAPFLHASPTHLMMNLLPLLLFMWLTMQWGRRIFILTTLCVMLMGGLGVWTFGRSAMHIGASGMVYGYFGFLLLGGFVSRRLVYLLISLLVIALYGGMVFGVLPGKQFISFEYHLFGFAAGLFSAWTWARRRNPV